MQVEVFLGEKGGKGRSVILLKSPVGQVETPSSSHIKISTPHGATPLKTPTAAVLDKEEATFLRAQNYVGTRISSLSDLNTVRCVLLGMCKEAVAHFA